MKTVETWEWDERYPGAGGTAVVARGPDGHVVRTVVRIDRGYESCDDRISIPHPTDALGILKVPQLRATLQEWYMGGDEPSDDLRKRTFDLLWSLHG